MVEAAIQPERLALLNDHPVGPGEYVLYWLQQAQRAEYNHTLEHAAQEANALGQPLLVGFGLMDDYPEPTGATITSCCRGCRMSKPSSGCAGSSSWCSAARPTRWRCGSPSARRWSCATRVACLRIQRAWRERLARDAPCRVVQVESDVVVPVELASQKKEHAARTLRPRLTKHLARFLVALSETQLHNSSLALDIAGEDLTDIDNLLLERQLAQQVPPVRLFKGGTGEAKRVLAAFLAEDFGRYATTRNQPQTSFVSHMSKYLHFGQISPAYVALEVKAAGASQENTESYLEELIIRRELPMNFVFYEPEYDKYSALPEWARRTLAEHRHDARDPHYSRDVLEAAEIEDPYWNAAMQEMKVTGYMHNYMRMYWGKKIL